MIALLFLTLLLLISYPILGFLIVRALIKKDKQRLYAISFVLIVFLLVPGFLWRILPGSDFLWGPIDRQNDRNFNVELTGFKFNESNLIYEYETKRDFNGDGYSIWIKEIDETTANYFKNPNEAFFTKHPNTTFRSNWESESWKRTPFDKKDQMFFDFAHSSLDELDFELEDLLEEPGNYYAFEFYMHNYSLGDLRVGNIDFYIICPARKIMVRINHNT
ncbi:MAG: hypothetical protein KTR22_02615 [Flavobacteriaceae bacterium]|nr:hypothetical protein [Flavobacteriaceae bacterium]